MSSSYGENIKLTIFGQSHSAAIGMTLEGIPAGFKINMDELNAFLARRAPGQNEFSTPRKEADVPEFLSGLVDDVTCGAPIGAIIKNTNTRSEDYAKQSKIPRPGHADYTAYVKYNGNQDYAGGGHFSGRLTAPLCIAGGICTQILKKEGIKIRTRILSIGNVKDTGDMNEETRLGDFPVVSAEKGELMKQQILEAKEKGDSVGGIIQCVVYGLPVGLGNPMFDGMENRISKAVFGIPAVKGIEFGAGFEASGMFGSENNDSFCIRNGEVRTCTNNAGGILGGITNGMPIDFKVAVKPTPSIAIEQDSVNLETMENTKLTVTGRHDPCIVPRALACVEAAAALAVYDAYLGRKKEIYD